MNDQPLTIEYSIEQICTRIGAELVGDSSASITGINTIANAGPSELCFLSAEKMASKVADSKAAAVLVNKQLYSATMPQLVVANVDAALIEVLNMFAPKLTAPAGIHPTVIIEDSAVVADGVCIGPHTYISHGVQIDSGCVIGANCSIGENSKIGAGTQLDSGVVVYHNCIIGRGCTILAGTIIGATGFGYVFLEGQHKLTPHNGGVIIEDGVDIGANACVDRAKFGNTIIGAGTKIDNLVQVGHGVKVGRCCLLCGHVGIGGSTVLGDGVVFGGQAGIADNLNIGAGAMVAAHSGLMNDLEPGDKVVGAPARYVKTFFKEYTALTKLPKALKELKAIAAKVDKLEASENDKN